MRLSIYALISFFLLFTGCSDKMTEIEEVDDTPRNLTISVTVSNDQSGKVDVTAMAENAFSYEFDFGDGQASKFSNNGSISYNYSFSGDYTITVKAFNLAGTPSPSVSENVSVVVKYDIPDELALALTGGASKNWVWQKNVNGHLGVGPADQSEPIWYNAQPFEKEFTGCFYTDVMTFTKKGDDITYTFNNNGQTYFNRGEVNAALGLKEPEEDQCYDWEDGSEKNIQFYASSSGLPTTTGISFILQGNGFLSYYIGNSDYEILSYTDTTLYLRTIQQNDAGERFAWYHRFIAEDAADFDGNNIEYELMWEDNFDGEGMLDETYWTYETGTGQDGWGNQEKQYYTDRLENAYMSDGTFKIVAKKEEFRGSSYTSARVITKSKLEFKYGKVVFRAKLPKGRGTWPALWMLGNNIDRVGWPACGEIDIMEHVGREEDRVSAALHTPSSFGATVNVGVTYVEGATDDFHNYELEWTPDQLFFRVDDEIFYAYNPPEKNSSTYPFDKRFFIIMNIAMGGTLGGSIAGSFDTGVMEIDYVKVFKPKQ